MENNFDLRDFLYNNTLLTESQKEKIEETIEESSNKMTVSELKAKIREDILTELKKESDDPAVGDEEEAHTGVEEGEVDSYYSERDPNSEAFQYYSNIDWSKELIDTFPKALVALRSFKDEVDWENQTDWEHKGILSLIKKRAPELLPAELKEQEEETVDVDVDVEEPAGEEDVFTSDERVEDAEKQAYDAIIQAGRAYKALGENPNMGGLKTMMDQLAYLERAYNYPPREDVFENEK